MAQNEDGDNAGGSRLGRFERNRFFHGKLMTARDMQAEQEYHTRRLNAVAKHVAGEGILTGLETSVGTDGEDVEVTIEPGLALDHLGRPVVVEGEGNATISKKEAFEDEGISIYLTYDSCVKETVPVPHSGTDAHSGNGENSGNRCRDECAYNRVLEIFDVDWHAGTPWSEGVDTDEVGEVAFPGKSEADEGDRITDDDVLQRLAEEYTPPGNSGPGDTPYSGGIFLGYFVEGDGSEWEEDRDEHPRPYVYTNDMLYAAIAQHAGDFDNPHEVTAEQAGAITGIEGVENDGGQIGLDSPDGTLSIDGNDGEDTVAVDLSQQTKDKHAGYEDKHAAFEDKHAEFEDKHGNYDDHLSNGNNPHGVTAAQIDALTSVAGVKNPGAGVDVVSTDDSLTVTGEDGKNRVDLSVAGDVIDRLDAHERYVGHETAKDTVESFFDVVQEFDGSAQGVAAADVITAAKGPLVGGESPTQPLPELPEIPTLPGDRIGTLPGDLPGIDPGGLQGGLPGGTLTNLAANASDDELEKLSGADVPVSNPPYFGLPGGGLPVGGQPGVGQPGDGGSGGEGSGGGGSGDEPVGDLPGNLPVGDLPGNLPEIPLPGLDPGQLPDDLPSGMPGDLPDDLLANLPDGLPGGLAGGVPEQLPQELVSKLPEDMQERVQAKPHLWWRIRFIAFVMNVIGPQLTLASQVGGDGFVGSERYVSAAEELETAVEELPGESDVDVLTAEYVLRLATIQREICQAARILAPSGENASPGIVLPNGDTISRGLVNQPLVGGVPASGPDVPNLVGRTVAQAQETLADSPVTATYVNSNGEQVDPSNYQNWRISEQSRDGQNQAGAPMLRLDIVPAYPTVADLVGLTVSEVQETLADSDATATFYGPGGEQVSASDVQNRTIESGTDTNEGEAGPPRFRLTLAERQSTVPNLVGRTVAGAQRRLRGSSIEANYLDANGNEIDPTNAQNADVLEQNRTGETSNGAPILELRTSYLSSQVPEIPNVGGGTPIDPPIAAGPRIVAGKAQEALRGSKTNATFVDAKGNSVSPQESPDHKVVKTESVEGSGGPDAKITVAKPESVTALDGIGPKRQEKLAELGVEDVADLSNADAKTLVEEGGFTEAQVADWREQLQSKFDLPLDTVLDLSGNVPSGSGGSTGSKS